MPARRGHTKKVKIVQRSMASALAFLLKGEYNNPIAKMAKGGKNMKNSNAMQAIKFALFSASAGIIQVGSFTILNELVLPNISIENEKIMSILSAEYGVCYLIALVLSVLWNFTFNRRFTFKSAANIPVAMAKVFGFYLVFTPVSTILGNMATGKGVNEYIVLGVTMLSNMVLEYLFCKFVVYKGQENTIEEKK